jgi:type II restriction enzyme
MPSRDFEKWFSTITDTIRTYTTWVDFRKVYNNADKWKYELNILNDLIGLDNIKIKDKFIQIIHTHNRCLQCIPLLLGIREKIIYQKEGIFDFSSNDMLNDFELSKNDYISFMEKTGLFSFMQSGVVKNLYDYVVGLEVGMDSNARKNRVGQLMTTKVQEFFDKEQITYEKEVHYKKLKDKYCIDLPIIVNEGKIISGYKRKRFDFVLKLNNIVCVVEVNFYSSGGSKLVSIAESYKERAHKWKNIKNFKFVWITDGKGWYNDKKSLEETFNVLENIYNLNDLEKGYWIKWLKE